MGTLASSRGLLLDIDGTLVTSGRAIPGAVETIGWLRARDIPFRLITNTTTHSTDDLAAMLGRAGFDIAPSEIVSAVVATVDHLTAKHPDARVLLLSDGDAGSDLAPLDLVSPGEPADVVVIGGAAEMFTYEALNHAFRLLMDGAALVGMHRNLYWRTDAGLELDGGAYVTALESAAGVQAVICGKPSPEFFRAALTPMGLTAEEVAMVGDDIVNDVAAAQSLGATGVLVRTGKYRDADMTKAAPDVVLESVAELPGLLGSAS